ncbi:MAG TPA: hypothetical protein VMK42_15095 [Anaeromyxobacteraceae bacterium]|nr:hypothetical protein [Anaeromyxobacteraceae bacterium]
MTIRRLHPALAAPILLALACTSGSSRSSSSSSPQAGIALPREVSALPAQPGAAAHLVPAALRAVALQGPPAGSDYASAVKVRYVNEQPLSQFDILNTIFGALAETHYADPANVGQGTYGAMVTWIDGGDSEAKTVKSWAVDSEMVQGVNEVKLWMKDMMSNGGPPVIVAKVDILAAPAQNTDGSYSDYGAWRIDARFDDTAHSYFLAAADHDGANSRVMMHQVDPSSGETLGILERSPSSGFGRVRFPDQNNCQSQPCPMAQVAYVYNSSGVALQFYDASGSPVGSPIYQDRTQTVDVVDQYALYDAATGEDVSKSHVFGFPISYSDASGQHWAYYGAWQGRHQVWGNGQGVPPGTTVIRQTFSGGAGESYTTSAVFAGILVKRHLVAADISDLEGLVLGTWLNESVSLRWSAATGSFAACVNPDYSTNPPACDPASSSFDLTTLASDPTVGRTVSLSGFPHGVSQPVALTYGGNGSFVVAATGAPWDPVANPGDIWANIGTPAYVTWNGATAQWTQKKIVSYDSQTGTASFDPAGDAAVVPPLGQQVYLNDQGTNYVVTRTGDPSAGAAAYAVEIEQQSVANPVNAATFAPSSVLFQRQWGGDTQSTFRFDGDSTSATFMKLVFASVGPQDQAAGFTTGQSLTSGEYGLALVGAATTSDQYNWEYPVAGQPSNGYGSQQFLIDAGGNYKVLDNPIRLAAVSLADHSGVARRYALTFDGSWVNGLPNVSTALQGAGGFMSAELAATVVVIPDGTPVADADTGETYLFKALRVGEYLYTLSSAPSGLDLAPAAALDLSVIPAFEDPGFAASMPSVPVKYVEGNPVP